MPAKYINTVKNLKSVERESILGHLSIGVKNHQLLEQQRSSWYNQIRYLNDHLLQLDGNWSILFEYPIPRRAKRIDLLIIANDLIIVLEFKDKAKKYFSDAIYQVEDYALDLRDFHKESFGKKIIPVVWASDAPERPLGNLENSDLVKPTLFANNNNLSKTILEAFEYHSSPDLEKINVQKWNNSEYLPTPTIIEAAQHMFAGQNVREISRSHAGSENLTQTTEAITDAIKEAKETGEKIICFITGVPGAGKTLAGLNIVHSVEGNSGKGIFLSGNGPLVTVLSEALAQDHTSRTRTPIGMSRREIVFVKNVHHFLDFYHNNEQVPPEKIVLFDEAQRAWSAEHSKRKFKRDFSEAEMLFNIMNRIDGWAVIVALIGSGQEINTGEAGLSEWGSTINEKYKDWKIYISPDLKEGASSIANYKLFSKTPEGLKITEVDSLHLKVSIRSYKAKRVSEWVEALLELQSKEAEDILKDSLQEFPIFISRDLDKVKNFLKSKTRGTRRSGLVASSGARRLRPLGLDVKHELEVAHWFLKSKNDIRSSSFLELPATEFAVQGLELDWAGVCWGNDFRISKNEWSYHGFSGSKWHNVRSKEKKQFIKNKYRVLLTRAREGFVIYVPMGSMTDETRDHRIYDETFDFLRGTGIPELK